MKKIFTGILTTVFTAMLVAMCVTANVKAERVLEFNKEIVLGETVEDSLTTGNGNGRYNFSISRSGTLTVQLGVYEGSSNYYGDHGGVTLYNADGNQIERVRVKNITDSTDSSVFTVDILAGEYYLEVWPETLGKKEPLNYYITTSYIDSQETVVDSLTNTHNSQTNPISLPLNEIYRGHIAVNSTADVYKLESTKSQYITFEVTNRTNGCTFKIINENNTVNQSIRITQSSQSEKVFCPEGIYYVTIGKSNATGNYTIEATASDIPTTTIKKVKNKRGNIMAVKFDLKNTQTVRGYQIQYATNKEFTKGKKSFEFENTDYLKSTYSMVVKKKKTYYVRIRTYLKDSRGDYYYSDWSPSREIRIRK